MIESWRIEHTLRFEYDAPVDAQVMTLHLAPIRDRVQVVQRFHLHTEPEGPVFEFLDPFANVGHFIDRQAPHDSLAIVARIEVEVGPAPVAPARLGPGGEATLREAIDAEQIRLWPMLHESRFARSSPALERFIREHGFEPGDDSLAGVRELRSKLHRIFEYVPGSTKVDSPIEHILETKKGVCQDYAHVMIAILRAWGIPGRYVSGYLAPAAKSDGAESAETGSVSGTEADGEVEAESHAWVEGWFGELGWIGFDPANDIEVRERHIRVAVGRDYADVPPTRGVFRGTAESQLETRVTIARS